MPFGSSCATADWTRASSDKLATLDTDDVRALAAAGAQIRQWVVDTPFPADLEAAIRAAVRSPDGRQPRPPALPCARRPPPKTCPMPRSPASRRPS
jgi:hypothetical protein